MANPASAIRTSWKPQTPLLTLFSPMQVGVAAFVGGPAAAIYVLRHNLLALGMATAARQVLLWGILFCIALMVVLPMLPENFPNSPIPIAYTVLAFSLARNVAPKDEAGGPVYERESNWRVARIAVVSFAATALVIVVCATAYVLLTEGVG